MKNKARLVYSLLIIVLIACNQTVKITSVEDSLYNAKNIFGLYSYFVTGYNSNCETVKHSIQLNADSTFIFKTYCMSNDGSMIKNVLKSGYFSKRADSLFAFQFTDSISFKVKFLNDSTIKIISLSAKEDQLNFPYKKES